MTAVGRRLIIAGGGTGGHVLAGVAIADAWKKREGDGSVVFVGAHGGLEEKLVPRAGYPLRLFRLGSLKRVSWKTRLRTLFQLPLTFIQAIRWLLETRPVAVIGVGGYASGPLVLMARVLGTLGILGGVRVAILEQNAVPGFTNRILGRFAHRVFTAFPGIERGFPAGKAMLTGNPVRDSMQPLPPSVGDPFTVFIFGGSQGALGVNTLVLESLPLLLDLKPRLRFIHQTGEADFERVRQGHLDQGYMSRVEKFIFDMPGAYCEASLLVCRAGSSTLSEIAAVGRASILIPFPYASDDHQDKNARIFENAGAALILPQFQSRAADLAAAIRSLVSRPDQVQRMETSARGLHRPGCAETIVGALGG
jgi:UDP-N-acetylglucosamine--N-acetylmuramyl-(pentapeptide) pyrophosphoryl-undecaprenol N-acetylglucosamine transferase